jgi:ribosomal protein L23
MSGEGLVISPLVTEKGTIASEKGNQVVFRIRPSASKDQIREVIEDLFKVPWSESALQISSAKNGAEAVRPDGGRIGKKPISRSKRVTGSIFLKACEN